MKNNNAFPPHVLRARFVFFVLASCVVVKVNQNRDLRKKKSKKKFRIFLQKKKKKARNEHTNNNNNIF